jgi:hypothetical protein
MYSGRILRHRKPEAPRGRRPRRYRASLTLDFMSGSPGTAAVIVAPLRLYQARRALGRTTRTGLPGVATAGALGASRLASGIGEC